MYMCALWNMKVNEKKEEEEKRQEKEEEIEEKHILLRC
jgi:hypothetical protein